MTEQQRTMAEAAFAQRLNVIHHAYVDIAGDLIAGALLGQVLYWFGADASGRTRARIVKDGRLWIAKARADWWHEIRISAKQYDRAVKVLKERGLLEVKTYKFNGNPTTHLSLNAGALNAALEAWKRDQVAQETPETVAAVGYSPKGNNDIPKTVPPLLPNGEEPNTPKGNNELPKTGTSITETPTETKKENTAKTTHTPAAKPPEGASSAHARHIETIKEIEEGFEEAWQQYPKKEGKAKARRAYEKAVRGIGARKSNGEPWTRAEILAEVILYRQHVLQRVEAGELERRYIPAGGTWFEGERWNDETPSISSTFADLLDGMEHNRAVSTLRRCAKAGALEELRDVASLMPY